GSPFFAEPLFNLTDYERDKPLFEAGTRWSRSFTGSDIAVMAAYLYENQLRHDMPANGLGDAEPIKNDYWLVGASANCAFGRLLLNADIAYSDGVFADTLILAPGTNLPVRVSRVHKDQIAASFGIEYG